MKALLLTLLLAAPAAAQDTLRAHVAGWDIGYQPKTAAEWTARLLAELDEALASRADVILFPELIGWGLAPYFKGDSRLADLTRYWNQHVLAEAGARLAGKDVLVVLGSYPHQNPGADFIRNRANVWHGGKWDALDKLRPTPGEVDEKPTTRPGDKLKVFPFRGAKAAVLICYSVEMPDLAQKLKEAGVRLLLVPAATTGEEGLGRVRRSASARAVELGAAVLVAGLTGQQGAWKNLGGPALYLPAQKRIKNPVRASKPKAGGFADATYALPWARLKHLHEDRVSRETRPFLD